VTALEPLACRSYVGLVTTYLEHELDEPTASAFEQHTLICEGCVRYLEQIRTTMSLVSGRAAPSTSPSPRVGPEPAFAEVFAYKFLAPGRLGPFTGFAWPEHAWVSVTGRPRACRRGVHACRIGDLPYWINEELWVVELGEPVVRHADKVVSVAGRLDRRVAGWTGDAAERLARHCAVRVRDRACDALRAARLGDEADRLDSAPDDELAEQLGALAERAGGARAACEYGAVAFEALRDPPAAAAAGAAYVAALAAAQAGGITARDAERGDQARWLQRELGLPGDGA
jgi:hypothetical protein